MRATRAFEQDRPGRFEPPTPGYNQLSVYGDYHWQLGAGEIKVSAQATNLLDETIRDHTSLAKYYAPRRDAAWWWACTTTTRPGRGGNRAGTAAG